MRSYLAIVALLSGAAACGGDSGSSPTQVVDPNAIAHITVTASSNLAQVGQAVQFTATAVNTAGATVPLTSALAWSTGSSSVATIDQAGKAIIQGSGTTQVSANIGGVAGSFALTVNPNVPFTRDTVFTLPQAWTPPNLTITQNTYVTFAFGGGIEHNALFRSTNPAGSPPDIQNFTNKIFQRQFTQKGTFIYDCTVHPGMTGTIIVQ